jgi:hypothetical protein
MSTRGPCRGPRVHVGKVHVRGPLIFVSQMSIFRVLHAWTISKSTRGHPFPAGQEIILYSYGYALSLVGNLDVQISSASVTVERGSLPRWPPPWCGSKDVHWFGSMSFLL